MSKVAIIGGGFSGVISSIYASKLNEVTIFERNNDILKKLLLTGNGRCNYFNSNIVEEKYKNQIKEFSKEMSIYMNKC